MKDSDILEKSFQVIHHLYTQIMTDQSETLSKLLDSNVKVLVYHGIMDMLLPVEGVSQTLAALNWTGSEVSTNLQAFKIQIMVFVHSGNIFLSWSGLGK